jgi:hypothetical protein
LANGAFRNYSRFGRTEGNYIGRRTDPLGEVSLPGKGFIAGRALLRMILASYCNCGPEDLYFTYGHFQKPGIESNGRLSQTVAFNLSHSADAIQIAIAAEGSLGIDVEHLGRKPDLDALLAECLTDEEDGRSAAWTSRNGSRRSSGIGSTRRRS